MRFVILAIALGLGSPAVADAGLIGPSERSWQGFAGQMSDNEWGDFFTYDDPIHFRDAYTIGGGVQWHWPVGRIGYVGAELNALAWFGEQTHLEFTAPVIIRTPRPRQVWIPSLAYGLGLSLATEPPQSEFERTGSSTELLAHWFFELEFGNSETAYRPYLRLHHRSDAWGTFDADTGSNAILVGLRRDF